MVWYSFLSWRSSSSSKLDFSSFTNNWDQYVCCLKYSILQAIHIWPFFLSGTCQEIWEECCSNCAEVGHPKEHRRDTKNVKTWEIGREFPSLRFSDCERGYGSDQRNRQEISNKPTCQVLGHRLICLGGSA